MVNTIYTKQTLLNTRLFFNYIPYNKDFISSSNSNSNGSTSSYKRLMNVQYYEGQKDYNLPEYGSDEKWILSIFDVFDLRFWDPSESWFTGFHPVNRRKLRPLGLTILIPTALFPVWIPVFVPSDIFSLLGWGWEYLLRSNITVTLLPFLEEYYEAPNEPNCLPAPFKVPEPFYGCAPPEIEAAPPIFPPENYTDLFVIELTSYGIPYLPFCLPYRNPFKIVFFIIQGILTALLGPLTPNNPVINIIFDFIEKIFGFDFILGNGEGTEALPVGMWQCILPQLFLLIVVSAFLIVVAVVIIFSCFKNCRLAFLSSANISNENEIKDMSHELQQLYEMVRILSITGIYNTIETKKKIV